MNKRTPYVLVLLAVIGAVVIAGCGGSSSSSSESSGGEGGGETGSATTGGGTVSGAEVSGLGTVLVDSEGMTVYIYTPDKGSTSVCYGECEAAWPPVVATGKPTAGEGATSTDLGTTKRKDGTLQVTYNGHPLYTFSGDKAPGEASGQELDSTWFVLDESGAMVEGAASGGETESEPASEESSGGGGGGY
jgi:predicted lipoprotein with Yx(FWY)xxD motif